MKPISDEELLAHLARRSADQLTAELRSAVLDAVVAARQGQRVWSFRPALILAPVAAAVVLAVLAYPLLLTLEPGPSATSTASPAPATSPSPPAPGEVTVHTAQQLSDMIGDPEWVGRVVLAEARIGNMMAPPPCIESMPLPCVEAVLGDVSGKNVVTVGWYHDSTEGHPDLPSPNDPAGLYAFKVWNDSAEYLGPVTPSEGGIVWSVDALRAGDHQQISYDLYPVSGWLVRTQEVPCPRPDLPQDTDLSYECGGAFITATATAIVETRNDLDPGGLHVQRSAFDEFAPNPRSIDVGLGPPGWTSDRAVYLVRPVGLRMTTGGEKNVWRMVGRLETQEPAPSPTQTAAPSASPEPTVSPSPSPLSEPTVYTAQQLSDMIGDPRWTDRVVLGEADIRPMRGTGLPRTCPPAPVPCDVAFLNNVTGSSTVSMGWRDTTVGEGERVDDGGTVRWLQRLDFPFEPGLFAFKVLGSSVEYLGPVVTNGSELSWPVQEVPVGEPNVASDDLYAVHGWLLESIIPMCPAPPNYGPDTSTEYWCGGSFLRATSAGAPQDAFELGGLHVQRGAYREFAPDPSSNHGQGTEPRYGTYLVRQIGCQPVVGGSCPVWRMVGRLF